MKATRFIALFAVILLVACGAPRRVVLNYKRELSALTMKVGVSGSFYLASGSFGSDPIYIFVEKDNFGMSAVKSIPVQKGVYIEDIIVGETPYVEFYDCKDGGLGVYCSSVEGAPEVLDSGYSSYNYYVFHVPQGTLATSYDLGFSPPQP
jgi:hypothetical protein